MSVRGDRQKREGGLLGILQGLMTPGTTLSGDAAIDRQRMLPPGRKAELLQAAGLQPQPDTQFPAAEYFTGIAGGPTQSLGATDDARAAATALGVGDFFRRGSDPTPVSQIPVVQDISSMLQNIRNRQRQTSANLRAIDARDSDDLGTAPTAINQQLSDLSASLADRPVDTVPSAVSGAFGGDDIVTETETTGTGTSTTTDGGSESSNANQAAQVEAAGTGAGTGDADGKGDEPYNPYGALLEKAMQDVAALQGKDPNALTKEDYMKEFAEATGVNISGEPDKSHALMAFGLALMQNKAGKGFDVSKMLGAVGEAGEKAMPAFQKAKEQARTERIAAGKYALSERKAAAASRLSQLNAAQERVQDLLVKTQDYFGKRILKQEERAHDLRMKNIDADLEFMKANRERLEKGQETKGFYNREPEYTGVKIRMGMTDNGNRTVYANPLNDGKDIALRYISMQRAQNAMDKTDALLAQIQESGIPALDILKGRVSDILVAGGADPKTVFGNKGIGDKSMSTEAEIKTLLNVLILENKRFATQETGNGISNQDRNDLADSFGQIDIFKNPAVARRALKEIRTIFGRPLRQIDSELESFMNNKNMYRSEQEYNQTIDTINSTLAESPFRPKMSKGQGGTIRYAIGDY